MASGGSRPRHSPCQNPPPIDPVEDELTRDPGSVGSPHLSSTSPTPSRNPTPGPDLVPALIPAPVFAQTPAPVLAQTPAPVLAWTPALVATNKLFKKFMKAYLKTNQGPRQPPVERKRTLKSKIPEVYYRIWTTITSINSGRIVSRPPGPPGPIELLLQLFFSMGTLMCAGHSSNVATEVRN